MNKHILLVMKWLNDKDSVSQEELEENYTAAYAAYAAYGAAAYAAYGAAADGAAADAAGYAADAAGYAAYGAAAYAAYWVDIYFERTNEDKQTYLDALENTKKPLSEIIEYIDMNGTRTNLMVVRTLLARLLK